MTKHDYRSCDRCGAVTEVKNFKYEPNYRFSRERNIEFDLCVPCIHQLSVWMEEGKTTESSENRIIPEEKKSLLKKVAAKL